MIESFDDFIGAKLVRAYYIRADRAKEGEDKCSSLTLAFDNGKVLHLDALMNYIDNIEERPTIKVQTGNWEIVPATFDCMHCNDSKLVPTKQSIGFGKANEIMQDCPYCVIVEKEKIKHKNWCAIYNGPTTKGFASSVTDCDCQLEDEEKPFKPFSGGRFA